MRFYPFGDRVLVKRVDSEKVTGGGIILPASVADGQRPYHGLVEAVGGDVDLSVVKVGDVVVYDKFAGTQIRLGADSGVERVVLSFSDLLGRVA